MEDQEEDEVSYIVWFNENRKKAISFSFPARYASDYNQFCDQLERMPTLAEAQEWLEEMQNNEA